MPRGLPPLPPKPNQSNVSKQISPMTTVLVQIHLVPNQYEPPTLPSPAPLVAVASGPLTLPTDKDLLGFCKGAFRLQIGLEAKAFKLANRPVGYSGMISTWRCEKCVFEGPVHNTSVLVEGKKKPSYKPVKLFDPKVRISETQGIRYKWAFLAKCHVVMKGMVPFDTALGKSGAWGSFGCIFCAAEGKQRGWLDKVPTGGEAASLAGSGASTGVGIPPTRVGANLISRRAAQGEFNAHLWKRRLLPRTSGNCTQTRGWLAECGDAGSYEIGGWEDRTRRGGRLGY